MSVQIILPRQDRPRLPAWLSHWEAHPDAAGDTFSIEDLYSQSSTLKRFSEDEARALGLFVEDYGDIRWSDIPKLAAQYSPLPVDFHSGQKLVISTIHQSKGLEYDNVLIYDPDRLIAPGKHQSGQLEKLFVALSRATSRLVALEKTAKVRPTRIVGRRPVVPLHHRVSPASVRVGPADVRDDILVGDGAGQSLLRDDDGSALVCFDLMESSIEVPVYRILLEGTPVGMTTNSFGAELKALTKTSRDRWPKLGPVPMDGVESAVSFHRNFGRPFLIPRPLGFADITF